MCRWQWVTQHPHFPEYILKLKGVHLYPQGPTQCLSHCECWCNKPHQMSRSKPHASNCQVDWLLMKRPSSLLLPKPNFLFWVSVHLLSTWVSCLSSSRSTAHLPSNCSFTPRPYPGHLQHPLVFVTTSQASQHHAQLACPSKAPWYNHIRGPPKFSSAWPGYCWTVSSFIIPSFHNTISSLSNLEAFSTPSRLNKIYTLAK